MSIYSGREKPVENLYPPQRKARVGTPPLTRSATRSTLTKMRTWQAEEHVIAVREVVCNEWPSKRKHATTQDISSVVGMPWNLTSLVGGGFLCDFSYASPAFDIFDGKFQVMGCCCPKLRLFWRQKPHLNLIAEMERKATGEDCNIKSTP